MSFTFALHATLVVKEITPFPPAAGKFQAVHTAARMSANSYIVLWQSDDGIKFEKIAEIREGLQPGAHNCGWSGDEQGHIKLGVQQYISYAYTLDFGPESWGKWNTRWAKLNW